MTDLGYSREIITVMKHLKENNNVGGKSGTQKNLR